ncbi:MAG: zf-HC2 domain-containing protein [Pyrinomonadaceae bacterium]|nr:zf-HC2 domain-containing protein [Pyrinomonadaceae bacterium]
MNCEKYLNLINDLVEGELDEQTAEQVNLHIFACGYCEAEFETLKREKESYAHFLFDIEPPKDLTQRFQTKLESLEQEKIVPPVPFDQRISNFFGFLPLKPLFAATIVLLVFGFGYFLMKSSLTETERPFVAESKTPPILPSENPKKEFSGISPRELAEVKNVSSKAVKAKFEIKPRTVATNKPIVKKPLIGEKTTPENLVLPKKVNLEMEEIRVFEIETAKQIEKVEMLLRSFRNARYAEDRAEYDVAYEKQQARKLLENNVRLRRQSEIYGTPATNEILSKVEPYLLEISNLNPTPSDEEVLEIKQRVRNQNIIAGLQGF